MRNFSTTLIEGQSNEEIIRNFWVENGFKVIDVSDNPEYQKKDIDFLLSNGYSNISVEVKSDTRLFETGNIAIELAMYRKTGYYPGWYHYCDADIICYCDLIDSVAYYIDWRDLKQFALEIGRKAQFYNEIDDCKGELCLVKLMELYDRGFIKYVHTY